MARHVKKRRYKPAVIIALSLCLALGAVGGTWAYLTSQTDPLTNVFEPAKVTCTIQEDFEDGIKSNVKVQNTGDVDAYIRAVVVATFVAQDGKVLSLSPIEGVDYTVQWANEGWQRTSDGLYWYHAKPVAPGAVTANLIETASAVAAPEGYSLNLQIIASAVQAAPAQAVQQAWGITPTDGLLIPN